MIISDFVVRMVHMGQEIVREQYVPGCTNVLQLIYKGSYQVEPIETIETKRKIQNNSSLQTALD